MEPTFYLRVLRLRWKVLALLALIGLGLGYATSLLDRQSDEPQVTYWRAAHHLIVNPDATVAGRFPNLLQTALLVTGGEIPEAVAADRGVAVADLTAQVRTITDTEVSVIEIYSVARSLDAAGAAAEAAEIADGFAAQLLEVLGERDAATYQQAVTDAQTEVDSQALRLDALETSVDDLQRQLGAMVAVDDDEDPTNDTDPVTRTQVEDELRTARIERDNRAQLYRDALDAFDDLERAGEPVPLMETLKRVEPLAISACEFNEQVRQGRAGSGNFNRRSFESGCGGGIDISSTVSNPAVRGVLGALAGLLIGIGAVLLHLRLDPRLRTKAEVEEAFDLPVIAEIPKFPKANGNGIELHALTRSRSAVTEAYRMVRSALLFARATPAAGRRANGNGNGNGNGDGEGPELEPAADDGTEYQPAAVPRPYRPGRQAANDEVRVVMVTSPGPSEGKTTTTANLAVVLAESGYEVLVVNCDYRIPKLHRYFDQPHEPRRMLDTGIPGVTLIADVADPDHTNPTTVVEAQRALIEKARGRYDVVLLDTAPMLATNDAISLLPVVDLVLLVAQEGKTDRDAAHESIDVLRRRQAAVAGVVLTGASGFGRSRYYYKYRYGNYYDADGNSRAQVEEAPTAADFVAPPPETVSQN